MAVRAGSPPDGEAASVAITIAAALREEILGERADGEHLGSEDQLVARYEVSRPTLRQAMRVLQTEGLVRIRRGNGGGFFASTPSAQVVTRSAAALLRHQGTDLAHLLDAARVLMPQVAVLAATNPDALRRRDFAAFVEHAWQSGRDVTSGEARDIATEVGDRLGALGGNPALSLFSNVLGGLVEAVAPEAVSRIPPAGIEAFLVAMRDGHRALARAVGEGDQDAARAAALGLVDLL